MRKNFKVVAGLVTFVSAALLMILVSSAIKSVQTQTEETCFTYLDEAADQLAEDLYKTTDMDHTILTAMATIIANGGEQSGSDLCNILNSYDSATSYVDYVEILYPDNTMLDADGTVRDVSESFDFNEEAKKGAYVSDISYSTKDPNERVIRNAVPVIQNGQTIYILYGVVGLASFEKAYTTNIYGGNAYVYLVDGNTGDFLLDTWHNSVGNISDFFNRKNISQDNFQDAAVKMKNGEGGNLAFVSQSTGDILYMHYEPVGINNWSVIVTVQDRYALKSSNEINNTLYRMAAKTGTIVFLYMLFVTFSIFNAYRQTRKLGMSDKLTGLQNRNAYDAFLTLNKDKTFELISCVFIDVNGLHELNNLKGHEAGDRMLRNVAETIQTEYPAHLVFRAGGDEFVAIIENMSQEECRAKAEIVYETLMKKGYSIAYGVATQQNVTGVSGAVHLADEQMLENKKLYYSKNDRRMR
ncbi:MAG: diguanylate cyclase [Lachnospiraceae bacterium]|nr:diguanylate cyclase [Lachnospiraceae bacterium]